MKKVSMLLVVITMVTVGLFAVGLGDGWRVARDPENVGKTNGWAIAVRTDAEPVPVPGVIQQTYPYYSGVAWYQPAQPFSPTHTNLVAEG